MANEAKIMKQQAQPGGPIGYAPMLNPFFGLLPPELWAKEKSFFIYGTDWNTIATAATVTNNIAIQADSDFLMVAGSVTTQLTSATAATQALGAFPGTVVITDAGSGRNLMNQAIHVANLFGSAQLPAYWPFPYLIKRNSTLQTQLANLDTANLYIVRLAYWGFKVFG